MTLESWELPWQASNPKLNTGRGSVSFVHCCIPLEKCLLHDKSVEPVSDRTGVGSSQCWIIREDRRAEEGCISPCFWRMAFQWNSHEQHALNKSRLNTPTSNLKYRNEMPLRRPGLRQALPTGSFPARSQNARMPLLPSGNRTEGK